MHLLPFKQPLTGAGVEVGLVAGGGAVEGLEDFELIAVSAKQPGSALVAELQPEAVVFAGHIGAVAG